MEEQNTEGIQMLIEPADNLQQAQEEKTASKEPKTLLKIPKRTHGVGNKKAHETRTLAERRPTRALNDAFDMPQAPATPKAGRKAVSWAEKTRSTCSRNPSRTQPGGIPGRAEARKT
jgi:hypothetical protein